MEVDVLLQLVNSGIGAVTLFILKQLWDEYKRKDTFIQSVLQELLEEQRQARIQRERIAQTVGITDSQLNLPIQRDTPVKPTTK